MKENNVQFSLIKILFDNGSDEFETLKENQNISDYIRNGSYIEYSAVMKATDEFSLEDMKGTG